MKQLLENEKAKRYLDSLDAAFCNGRWQELPELARKVEKHAPHRRCLTTAARAESEISLQLRSQRLTTSSVSNPLSHLVSSLENVIKNQGSIAEDTYQAEACLGWLYWHIGDSMLAVSSLPKSPPEPGNSVTGKTSLRGWTQVCTIRSAYVREQAAGNPSEALRFYGSLLPQLSSSPPAVRSTAEYRAWTEKYLTRYCMLSSRHYKGNENPEASLSAFRAWSKLGDGKRHLWLSYYMILSNLLQNGYIYPESDFSPNATVFLSRARLRQSAELQRVEEAYERLLLSEVSFPQAGEINHEVNSWVNQVVSNWRVTCGPHWQDEDIGQGGQEAASRKVLDILYRAATRTFHSTPILRHLFIVHISVAEFDLAGRALDSYISIVIRSKSRIAKSGQPEPGVDSDEVMLRTISTGIEMLCSYGRPSDAVRARDLALHLEKWLEDNQSAPSSSTEAEAQECPRDSDFYARNVSGSVLATVYWAIGISQAFWARHTSEALNRADLQQSAIKNFCQALQSNKSELENVDVLYSLALARAEIRDTDSAIETIKLALSNKLDGGLQPTLDSHQQGDRGSKRPQWKRTLKSWHLLALLLSARQDFDTADVSCEAALHDFDGFQHLSEESRKLQLQGLGLAEKKQLFEIKMTQMTLTEINEGPEVAVNAGGDLLQLYTSFFKTLESSTKSKAPSTLEKPPGTSSSTVRSVRGSMFGRSNAKTKILPSTAASSIHSLKTVDEKVGEPTQTPSLLKNGYPLPADSNHIGGSLRHSSSKKLQKRNSIRSMRRSRTTSPARTTTTVQEPPQSIRTLRNVKGGSVTSGSDYDRPNTSGSVAPNNVGVAISHNLPTIPASPMIDFGNFSPNGNPEISVPQPPQNSKKEQPLSKQPDFENENEIFASLSASLSYSLELPQPRLSSYEEQKQSRSLLIKYWLFIAGLYRRAKMFDDAKTSANEALKQVKEVEVATIAQRSSAAALEDPGWCGGKSVEELWADVYAERGHLCLARELPHEAIIQYESALSHDLDHPAATISLSNILLDIYTEIIPPYPKVPDLRSTPDTPPSSALQEFSLPTLAPLPIQKHALDESSTDDDSEETSNDGRTQPPGLRSRPSSSYSKTPEALNRLAARDRAYGMLSSLTKLGTGWDNSEAWYALARSYELSGQLDRAKELLWWVVDLEEKRPIRHWSCLGQG